MVKMKKYNVAVVGATGAVGLEMVKMLEKRDFPVGNLVLFASSRTAGKKLSFKGKEIIVEDIGKIPESSQLKSKYKLDFALFSAGSEISKEWAPRFAEQGIYVIDNSSYFRMEKDVPLVVPEVNPNTLSKEKKIIANPNCSTIQMVVVLKPLHDAAKIKRIIVSTYQAVSGAGRSAMNQLEKELEYYLKHGSVPFLKDRKFPRAIAFNLFPQVGGFDESGMSVEEAKVEAELKKIWSSPGLKISSTAVRVPVLRGHSLSIWAKTEKKWSLKKLENILTATPGLEFIKNPYKYPTPLDVVKTMGVKAGRLRLSKTSPNEFQLWIVSDNLYKGAALNSVEIAECLLRRGLLKPGSRVL